MPFNCGTYRIKIISFQLRTTWNIQTATCRSIMFRLKQMGKLHLLPVLIRKRLTGSILDHISRSSSRTMTMKTTMIKKFHHTVFHNSDATDVNRATLIYWSVVEVGPEWINFHTFRPFKFTMDFQVMKLVHFYAVTCAAVYHAVTFPPIYAKSMIPKSTKTISMQPIQPHRRQVKVWNGPTPYIHKSEVEYTKHSHTQNKPTHKRVQCPLSILITIIIQQERGTECRNIVNQLI